MLVRLLDVLTHRLGHPILVYLLLERLFTLKVREFKQIVCAALKAIKCAHLVNEKLEEYVHVSLVRYDQVDVTMGQLQRDALPAVEWHVLELVEAERVEMLA